MKFIKWFGSFLNYFDIYLGILEQQVVKKPPEMPVFLQLELPWEFPPIEHPFQLYVRYTRECQDKHQLVGHV